MPSLAFTIDAPQTRFDFSAPLGGNGPRDAGSVLQILHRDPESLLTFARQAPGTNGPRDMAAVRVGDVPNMLPGLFQWWLERDGYYSLNGFESRTARRLRAFAGALRAHGVRRNRCARRLNVAYVDIDNCDPIAGTAAIRQAVIDGAVPMPSAFVHSGRGLWALWLLRDPEDAGQAPPATEGSRFLYELVHRALHNRLRDRVPGTLDESAKDVARLSRVCGSVNSKVDRPVLYSLHQNLPSYELRALAESLGAHTENVCQDVADDIPPVARREPRPPTTNAGRFQPGNAFARDGARARHIRQLQNFEVLRALRGGFRDGHRELAAFCFAIILRRIGADEDSIARRVARMGGQCLPPLDAREQQKAITGSRRAVSAKWRPQTNRWYAAILKVTPDECAFLPSWPAAGGARRRANQQRRSRQNVSARRRHIRAIVAGLGYTPTQQDLAVRLADAGAHVSHRTIVNDYRALSLHSGTSRGRRRATQNPLPLTGVVSSARRRTG